MPNTSSFLRFIFNLPPLLHFDDKNRFGVDGLVPASMLPRGGNPKADYHAGDNVSVLINEMANEGKKMTLSLVGGSAGGGSSEGGSLDGTGFNKDQWMQGVVTSVSNFGLFVRPAGYDMVGLVHSRQIPRDLMASLKKQVDVSNPGDKTDVELLFQEGDVVSCRVNSFNGPKKLDMSMLPPKDEEEADDYVVDGRDPEEDGQEGGQRRRSSKWAEDNEDSQAVSAFNGEGKLLWWRGAPYTPLGRPGNDEDVEMAVITESDKVVEGVWRRMFEVDLREDAADFSSRVNEQELKELQSDIGELMGLDDDMFEMNDLTLMSRSPMTVGASAMGLMDQLPDDWKSELSFFKETSTTQSALDTMYKGGKAAEQSEFDALIREVEVEIQANKKSGEPEIEVAPEAISAEAAAPAAPAEAAAPEEAAADAEAPAEAEA
jgi:predicted RNA-binding protein with RPS1 domain